MESGTGLLLRKIDELVIIDLAVGIEALPTDNRRGSEGIPIGWMVIEDDDRLDIGVLFALISAANENRHQPNGQQE